MEHLTKAQRAHAVRVEKDTFAWDRRQEGLTFAAIGVLMGVSLARARQRVKSHERRLKRQVTP